MNCSILPGKRRASGFLALLIWAGIIILTMLIIPDSATAAMENSLSNEACLTCHKDYPAVKQSGTYNVKHDLTNCTPCHNSKVTDAMWNCRFCHISLKFKGGNSFYLHKTPTLSEGMNRHSWDGGLRYVDATFTKHNNEMATKHSAATDPGCLECHNQSLTEEHSGGTLVKREDFEDTAYNFAFTGNWYRNNAYPYRGTYAFRSATIPNNTSTTMETTVNMTASGKISFWYRVSSETNYDKFYFYLDGVEKLGGVSGNTGWIQVFYPLSAGSHTLKWSYVKDQYDQWFEDSVFVDEIVVYNGGRAFDCNTCHMSTDTNVKNAIANHNTNCSACHPNADHELSHKSGMDTECQSCHTQYLNTDHQAFDVTCGQCHNSSVEPVVWAVQTGDKYCGACHGDSHGVPIQSKLAADIPLYPGFSWSTPMSLQIWQGEEWLPDDMAANGKVLVSDRGDIGANAIWSFYKTQMAENGWILNSAEPAADAAEIRVEFKKDLRTCIVWYHDREDHSNSGTGSRLELIYN